jgi:DNA-binding MarR family transcriptional regulator
MAEDSWYDAVGTPGLMRAARGSYAAIIGADLAEAGFDDLPRYGTFALALLIHTGELQHLTGGLGVRKRVSADLIDALVMRGYLERPGLSGDGRPAVRVTGRGQAAQRIASETTARLDALLAKRLGADGFDTFRQGLLTLADIRARVGHDGGEHAGHEDY